MRNLSNDPPPGVGPYMYTQASVNRGFTLKRNPGFARFAIPDIPTGHVDTINVTIVSNTQSEAQQVLNNQADVFDAGDTLPPSLLPQIESQASDRFARVPIPSTYYFFLNTTKAPFNNEKARQAVNMAIDREAMVRLASGFLKPTCWFLPDGIVGHPGRRRELPVRRQTGPRGREETRAGVRARPAPRSPSGARSAARGASTSTTTPTC